MKVLLTLTIGPLGVLMILPIILRYLGNPKVDISPDDSHHNSKVLGRIEIRFIIGIPTYVHTFIILR